MALERTRDLSNAHVQEAVRQDPSSAAAQAHRRTLGRLFSEREEVFMASTVETAAGDARRPEQKI